MRTQTGFSVTIPGGVLMRSEGCRDPHGSHMSGQDAFISSLIVLAALVGGARAAGAASPKALARQILTSPGVRQGLYVHIGPSHGLTLELAAGGKNLVHGLCDDPAGVEKARSFIRSAGPYGRASAERLQLLRLPYADNMVNVLIAEDNARAGREGLTLVEMLRVVAPGGAVFLGKAEKGAVRRQLAKRVGQVSVGTQNAWVKLVKPYPEGMDEWRQAGHDPSRARISEDKLVAPPTGVRWIVGGSWERDRGAYGPRQIVSSGGRNFYLYAVSEKTMQGFYKHIAEYPPGYIVARDAFNGLKLWERETESPTQLIAVEGQVFTTLDARKNLVALDAATGEITKNYNVRADSVTYCDGTLLVGKEAYAAAGGKRLWRTGEYVGGAIVAGGRIYLNTSTRKPNPAIVCLDLSDGQERWRAPNEGKGTLVCHRGGMLFTSATSRAAGYGKSQAVTHHAFSAEDGRHLWSYDYVTPYKGRSDDLYFLGGYVWVHLGYDEDRKSPTRKEAWVALDPGTGKETKRTVCEAGQKLKLRCYGHRATERFIILGGMDFFDVREGRHLVFHGTRGVCVFGYFPANGLVYQSRNMCACFQQVHGTMALSSGPFLQAKELAARSGERLEKGPARGSAARTSPPARSDWPTFRHDIQRSGSTETKLPVRLGQLWEAKIGGRVSPLTVARGKVFVAAIDEHRVSALDADTGKPVWDYTAGGRVDSPPTVDSGLVLFGSRDGYVYCLEASRGGLVWRFRAAPEDRRIVVSGQLESVWPVHGSVLVKDGVAFFSAGRHSEVDGGICLHAVDVRTGRAKWEKQVIRENLFQQTAGRRVGNIANDVITSDGRHVFLGGMAFDPASGERRPGTKGLVMRSGTVGGLLTDFALPPYGFKHGGDYYRTYWSYLRRNGSSLAGDSDRVFGGRFADPYRAAGGYTLFGARGKADKPWTVKVPEGTWMKAVLLAGLRSGTGGAGRKLPGDAAFFACQSDLGDKTKGELRVHAAVDGKELNTVRLGAAPIFDGLAAAEGRLYVSTQAGTVICLGAR